MTSNPRDQSGVGFEAWGDPWGVGGPLHVVRARAVESQTVRVVFDEPPLFRIRGGTNDGKNPLNYQVSIEQGSGTPPQVVGVKPDLVEYPAAGVLTVDERGVDVQTDRKLVVGIAYQVEVFNVVSALNGALGSPTTAIFEGIAPLPTVDPPLRSLEFYDFKFDPFDETGGAYVFNDGGDIARDEGLENVRKRVLRRISTPKNAYAHLPGYGTTLPHKRPMSVRELAPLKQDILQQVQQEPEVVEASVTLNLQSGDGILTVRIVARTRFGNIDETIQRSNDGEIVIT